MRGPQPYKRGVIGSDNKKRSFGFFAIEAVSFFSAALRVSQGYLPSSKIVKYGNITTADKPASFWATIGFLLLVAIVSFIWGALLLIRYKKVIDTNHVFSYIPYQLLIQKIRRAAIAPSSKIIMKKILFLFAVAALSSGIVSAQVKNAKAKPPLYKILNGGRLPEGVYIKNGKFYAKSGYAFEEARHGDRRKLRLIKKKVPRIPRGGGSGGVGVIARLFPMIIIWNVS